MPRPHLKEHDHLLLRSSSQSSPYPVYKFRDAWVNISHVAYLSTHQLLLTGLITHNVSGFSLLGPKRELPRFMLGACLQASEPSFKMFSYDLIHVHKMPISPMT